MASIATAAKEQEERENKVTKKAEKCLPLARFCALLPSDLHSPAHKNSFPTSRSLASSSECIFLRFRTRIVLHEMSLGVSPARLKTEPEKIRLLASAAENELSAYITGLDEYL